MSMICLGVVASLNSLLIANGFSIIGIVLRSDVCCELLEVELREYGWNDEEEEEEVDEE